MNAHFDIAIGFDVGGTNTRAASVDASGRVASSRRGPTPSDGSALFHRIGEWARDLASESASLGSKTACIGVAMPGVVDRAEGVLVRSVNLAGLEGRRIVDELEKIVGLPIVLMTDAEAATWGEYSAGRAHRGCFAHIRLGTGIACGIVRGGRPMAADPTRTTHWELLVVDRSPGALKCPCGLRGCLELFASGRALDEQARAIGLGGGIVGLQAAFAAGCAEAGDVVRATASAVCAAIGNIAGEFGVETVLIGGGVIERLPGLLEEITHIFEPVANPPRPGLSPNWGEGIQDAPSVSLGDKPLAGTMVIIGRSRLGDEAGVIGAALLARAATCVG